MSNVINIPDISTIQDKMATKLSKSTWNEMFKYFIRSSEYAEILKSLIQDVEGGHRFTPKVNDSFNAFIKCPLDQLKVVIIGQDPYPQLGVADGLAFSCSNTHIAQPSLRYMLNAINETVDVPDGYTTNADNYDLSRWAEQGVLLLNTALTTRLNKPGSHRDLWKPFMVTVLDFIFWNKPGIIYILLGKEAESWESIIGDSNYILKASHPASAAYAKAQTWDSNNVFITTNKILGDMELPEIIW